MGKRKPSLLAFLILTGLIFNTVLLNVTQVESTISGTMPPESGDWIVNTTTTVIGENLLLNGSIIVNNTLTIINSTITFNDTHRIEITENGELILKNVTVSGLNLGTRWYLIAQPRSKLTISNCTFINVGVTDGAEDGSITIKTNNVYINETVIENALAGLYLRDANNVTVEKLKINSIGSFAVRISNSENIRLKNVEIQAAQNGLLLIGAKQLNITNMHLTTNGLGIDIYSGTIANIIVNNTLIESNGNAFWNSGLSNFSNFTLINTQISTGNSGLDLTKVKNIMINNVTINANNAGISIDNSQKINISLLETISKTGVLLSNVTDVKLSLLQLTANDVALQEQNTQRICIDQITVNSQNNGLAFYNASSTTVKNGIINANNVVIRLYNVTDSIFNNTVLNTDNVGLAAEKSNNVTFTRFHVIANKTLLIGFSSNITLIGSSSYSNFEPTIWNSTSISITATIFISNYTSLILDNVTHSTLVSNTFTSKLSFGLRLVENSSYNTIMGNQFLFSKGEGLYIKNGTGNLIYLNYFIANNENKTQVKDLSTGNRWDNGTIGNYYFNYNGSDLDHDGIGDQPYQINSNTLDHYPIVIDNDHDGINDAAEVLYYNTNPNKTDTDNDGINDGEEIFQYSTNPLSNDTDGDGMIDGWEITNGLDPHTNDSNIDSDNDGLTNLQEYNLGTNPKANDTDGDGMPDGWEVNNGLNPLVDDASQDPDDDGLTNVQEYSLGTNPKANDTDGDGLIDSKEVEIGTDPLKADTDGDGLSDGQEVARGLNPLSPDTDGDGDLDSTDPLPTINNYVLVLVVIIVVVGAVGAYFYMKKMKA